MKCRNCGADITDGAKFCEYCGNKVELENQSTNNLESTIVENDSIESVNAKGYTNEVDLDKTMIAEPIKTDIMEGIDTMNLSVNNQENQVSNIGQAVGDTNQNQMSSNISSTQNLESNKEKNNKMLFIVGGVVLAVIAIVLVCFAYMKSSNNSIDVLKKAIANLSEQAEKSATVNTSITLGASTGETISLSATVKAEKKSDEELDMLIKVNESLLFDEINIYASMKEKEITMYMQSTLIDMLGTTESLNPTWVYYTAALDELMDEEITKETINDIDLKDIIDKKHFVYIEETNEFKRYQLVIDQELIDSLKVKLQSVEDEELKETFSSMEELEKTIKIDFYINKSNELSKIELDISDHLEDTEDLSSFMISMEFSELNNTKVEIPNDAKSSTIDLETYMISNAVTDYSYDTDLDTNIADTNFGF